MYIGNDLQIAHPSYKIIDDISSGFNGSTTSFALQVSGATPVPFPISTQQVMISVNGVVQEPDPSGSAGFKLLGSNIVFSSAPANGHAFFGVINAGADYVTAGSEFPDGSATAPSFTFQDDQDTGWFRSGSGAVGYSANGVQTLTFDGNGLTVTGDASFIGDSSKNLLWDKSDGQLEFTDDAKAVFGAGSDLQVYHNSGNTDSRVRAINGDLLVYTFDANDVKILSNSENAVICKANGAVELYHDNVKKFETFASGITVLGSEGSAGQIQLFSDEGDDDADKWRLTKEAGNNSFRIQNYTSGSWETNILATGDGAVELYHDGVKKCETHADGLHIGDGGNLDMPHDSSKIVLGASDDLQIFHNTHSYIRSNVANQNIYIEGVDNEGGTPFIYLNPRRNQTGLSVKANQGVDLYYDNSKKLETTSGGINVTGQINVNGSALSAAPTITATANGAISANAAVIVESDGKVAAISGYNFAQGSDTHQFAANPSGSTRELAIASDPTNNQTVAVYDDSGLKCIVATYSGTTPTLNTYTSINTSGNSPAHMAICNISSGVYIVAYAAGSDAYARVLTVSGSGSSATVAVGADLDFSIGSATFLNPQLETLKNQTNRALLLYVDDHNGDSGARVLTISGTGSSATIATTSKDSWMSSEATYLRTAWDNDNNVVVAFYRHSAQSSGYATLFSVSGTTITDGADQSSLGFSIVGAAGCYDSTNNIYVQFGKNSGNNYVYYKTGVFSSGNNYISWTGSTTAVSGNATSSIDDSLRAVFDEFSGNIILMYAKSETMYMQYGKYSSGSITWNTEVEVTGGINSNGDTSIAVLNQGRVPIIRKLTSNTGAGKLKALQFPGTTLTTENFIGFASAGYSNGATATINVTGNTTTQSSLTPAQKYYLQNDGSLGLTAADPSVAAGRALTSTKLLINTGD